MSPESDAKYEAWKAREASRPSKAEQHRLRELYAKPAKPKPTPAKVEPEQLSLFDYEVAPTENGHTR